MHSLLHPELLTSIPITGGLIQSRYESMLGEMNSRCHAGSGITGVTVAIRAMNEENTLPGLLADISQQDTDVKIDVVVIDNKSSDHTAQIAENSGARVVTLPRDDFTYPKSMNAAMDAARNEVVYMSVGHALLTSTAVMSAVTRRMSNPKVAGVFARTLPSTNATRIERAIAIGNFKFTKQRTVQKAIPGVMAAQGAAFRKSVWEEQGGFDESYGMGGEDLVYGRRALEAGYTIWEDPLVAVHHTHGLGPINTARQWMEWLGMTGGGKEFSRARLSKFRPDLDFS